MTFRSRRTRLLMAWGLLCLTLFAVSPRPTCICSDGGQKVYCVKVLAALWHGDSAKLANVPACCENCRAARTDRQPTSTTDDVGDLINGSCELFFTTIDCRVSNSDDASQAVAPHDVCLLASHHENALFSSLRMDPRSESTAGVRSILRPKSVLRI